MGAGGGGKTNKKKFSKNVYVSEDVIFYLFRYNMIRWSFFLIL